MGEKELLMASLSCRSERSYEDLECVLDLLKPSQTNRGQIR